MFHDLGKLGSETLGGTGDEMNKKYVFVINQQYKYKYKQIYGSNS